MANSEIANCMTMWMHKHVIMINNRVTKYLETVHRNYYVHNYNVTYTYGCTSDIVKCLFAIRIRNSLWRLEMIIMALQFCHKGGTVC